VFGFRQLATFLVTFLFLSNPEGEVRKYLALSPPAVTGELSRFVLQKYLWHNEARSTRAKV
jgi:hypothetical protein